jgi:diaminopimelate epimerase
MHSDQNTSRPAISELNFLKMHGLGNDFVIIDSRGGAAKISPALAKAIGDRHRGVGFDQLAEILDSDDSDILLEFWNSDGSRAGACGNATRCVGRLILDETGTDAVTIRTERGILHAVDAGTEVSVNMGQPLLDWDQVPLSRDIDVQSLPLEGAPFAVSMGNPHAVFFVDDAEAADVSGRGVEVEHDPLFPERTNVEFAQIRSREEIRMRVWERGAGITLACGSGACATLVASASRGLTEKTVRLEMDGGWITLDWREDGVWMTGPTALTFKGAFDAAFLAAALESTV